MAKKTNEYKIDAIAKEIPEEWSPKKRKAYAIFEIERTIELLGVDNLNKAQLSRKYHFNWHTIDSWITNIILAIPKEQINLIASKAEFRVNRAFERLAKIAVDPGATIQDRISAEKEIREANASQIKILESYGRKSKVPEQVELKSDGGPIFQIIEMSDKEIKDEKSKHSAKNKTSQSKQQTD